MTMASVNATGQRAEMLETRFGTDRMIRTNTTTRQENWIHNHANRDCMSQPDRSRTKEVRKFLRKCMQPFFRRRMIRLRVKSRTDKQKHFSHWSNRTETLQEALHHGATGNQRPSGAKLGRVVHLAATRGCNDTVVQAIYKNSTSCTYITWACNFIVLFVQASTHQSPSRDMLYRFA